MAAKILWWLLILASGIFPIVTGSNDSCGMKDAVLTSEAGEVQILVLIDLHGPAMDGQPCTVLDTEAALAIEAFVWMVNDLNNNEVIPGIKIGYAIYDTCQEPEVVGQVMSSIQRLSSCSSTGVQFGMIMTSGAESTRASVRWMSLMRLPHIVIPQDSHAILSSRKRKDFTPFTLAIPDASTLIIEALPEILSSLNSSYATAVSGGNSMIQLGNTFRMNAFQEGMCIPNHVKFNPITKEMVENKLYTLLDLYPSVKAIVSFLEPEDMIEFKNAAASNNKADDYFWLMVTNSSGDLDIETQKVDPAQNFLFVQPHHIAHDEFRQYILNKTINKKFDNPFIQEYIEMTHKCYFDVMRAGHSKRCDQLRPEEIEREYKDTPVIAHVMKSLKAILTSVEDAWTRKCRMREGLCPELAELDPDDLMKYLTNVKTSFGKNRREMMSVRFSDGMMSRGVAIRILMFGPKGTKLHQLGILDGGRMRMNQSAFEIIKASLPKSNCEKCEQCRSVDEKEILYTDRTSDAYFTGVFYPPPGETVCSLMRVQAMETFYLALQLEKDGEEDRLPGVNFGALIIEDEGIYASSIRSTSLPPDERTTPPIHTLGRILLSLSPGNTAANQRLKPDGGKYSDNNVIAGLAKYMNTQNIKYVSLIYAGGRDTLTKLRNKFTTNEVCFSSVIEIPSDGHFQEKSIASQMTASIRKSLYFILAINDADIVSNIISTFKNVNSTDPITWIVASSLILDFFFLPTHHSFITINPPAKYQAAIQNHFNQITGYDISVKTWLADYYRGCSDQRKTADITEMSDVAYLYGVLMAVKKLVQSSHDVYGENCDAKGLCEEYFKKPIPFAGIVQNMGPRTAMNFEVPWDIIKYEIYGGNWRRQTFGTIDENGELHGVGVTDSKTDGEEAVCDGWCPQCLPCSDRRAPEPAPVVRGELNIAALLHAHQLGSTTLDCGLVYSDNEDYQLIEAFLYALDTVETRNPDLKLWDRATVGGIILDTCTSITKTLQTISNFEGCSYVHEYDDRSDYLHPESVLVYIIPTEPVGALVGMVHDMGKVMVGTGLPEVNNEGEDIEEASPVQIMPYYVKLGSAIMDLLRTFNWTFVGMVLSDEDSSEATAEVFIDMISGSKICVGSLQIINDVTDTDEVITELDRISDLGVIILFTTAVDTIKLLHSVKHRTTRHFQWVLLDANEDAVNVVDVRDYALGAVAVRSKIEPEPGFKQHYRSLHPDTYTRNPWFSDFWERRFKCRLGLTADDEEKKDWVLCSGRESLELDPPHPLIPFIFESVDMIVKSMDTVVGDVCSGSVGLCQEMSDTAKVSAEIREKLHSATIHPSEEDDAAEQVEFSLHSYQMLKPGQYKYVQVATYQRDKIRMESLDEDSRDRVKIEGEMRCSDCQCLNLSSGGGFRHHLNSISGGRRSTVQVSYIGAIWITVVLTVAGIGVIVCFAVIAYIIYKKVTKSVENGTVMGVLLLLGIALLYSTTVTFAMPPNEASCGLRIFLVAFAYTFCYAVILLKAMNLRSMRLLGIGGEVSSLNEHLTLTFIVAVQVALTIQWWLHHAPLAVISRPGQVGLTVCTYTRLDYAQILIYPLVVLLIAAVYSITVRQMKQNCHEIKFLLIACWLCIISSFTWYLILVVGSEKVREPTICVGALVCATLMLVAIFLPKVHLLATMKYNLNKIAFDGFGRNYRGAPGGTSSTEFTFYDVSGIRPKSVNRVNFNEGRNTDSLSNNYKF